MLPKEYSLYKMLPKEYSLFQLGNIKVEFI
jgi:hypothetical protein